jgi:23S rRNA (adenine2503-C2)-methyltransferase
MQSRIQLKGLLPHEMKGFFESWGFPPYRAQQVQEWIYRKQAMSFEEMTNLPKTDREFLETMARIGHLEVMDRERATDGTEKWLLKLEDGLMLETVLIPEGGHWTQCLSTQVGCAMGCTFCRTARLGLRRQLRAWEILDQVVVTRREFKGGKILNLVFMGMGEPLANYESVIRAIRLLLDPVCLDFSKRRITLSTCGLIPGIRLLAGERLGINLAVSLNATTQTLRSRIMPVNRTYHLHSLLQACREFPLPARGRMTFEYVLMEDVNDTSQDAERLVRLLRGIPCKINLIPHNGFPGSAFRAPHEARIRTFQRILIQAHLTAPIRWSRGSEISAACGQLAGDLDVS